MTGSSMLCYFRVFGIIMAFDVNTTLKFTNPIQQPNPPPTHTPKEKKFQAVDWQEQFVIRMTQGQHTVDYKMQRRAEVR